MFQACLVPNVTNVPGIAGPLYNQFSRHTWSQLLPMFPAYSVPPYISTDEDAWTRTSLTNCVIINSWPNAHTLCNRRSWKGWQGHHRLREYLKLLPMAKLTISLNQLFSAPRLSALANLSGDDGKLRTYSMKNDQYVDKNLSGHPLIRLFYALWQKSKMQTTSKPEISWLSRPLEKASMEIILPHYAAVDLKV